MEQNMQQRSPEWFATRRGRITASSVGAILGLAPYATRADVMRRMVREHHGADSEFSGNIATEYGEFNEPGALLDFRIETGLDVKPIGFITFEDWAGASPDGLIGQHDLLEIKCPFGKRKDAEPEFKTLEQQPHYYAQVQFQLLVTGRKQCHFFQWAPKGTRHEIVPVDRIWLDTNLPKLRQFYAEYLAAIETPEEYLAPKRVIIDTPQAAMMLREWDELNEALDRATERKKALLEEFATLAGQSNAEINGRKLTRVQKDGAISYAKAIKDLLPKADLEPYRGKPSAFWKLG